MLKYLYLLDNCWLYKNRNRNYFCQIKKTEQSTKEWFCNYR
ncbi:unnamed protein product [Paramecium octaurelia]|uniref:Uncharacterized protein n=1 Tax=Paramecium octaurelia TaxID=43137 RepID=A0A8S1X2T9_PAROT|nr:unnamed protein product [Paramecium octaurelia]